MVKITSDAEATSREESTQGVQEYSYYTTAEVRGRLNVAQVANLCYDNLTTYLCRDVLFLCQQGFDVRFKDRFISVTHILLPNFAFLVNDEGGRDGQNPTICRQNLPI